MKYKKEYNMNKKLQFNIDGWWDWEYNTEDGTLTDNNSVFVQNVPQNEIDNALVAIRLLYNEYGYIGGDYNGLCDFVNQNLSFHFDNGNTTYLM